MGRKLAAALLAVGSLGGCNYYYNKVPSPDDLVKMVPWFDHMVKSPMVSPYQRLNVPRNTPPGAIPITGGEASWDAGTTAASPTFGFDTLVAKQVVNPTDGTIGIARGDTLFNRFCAVCHNGDGAGNGPVGVIINAPSLLTDKAKALSDGQIYSIIRYGRANMPLYGDKIHRAEDRWAVVNYLRSLQGVRDTTTVTTAAPAQKTGTGTRDRAAKPKAGGKGK